MPKNKSCPRKKRGCHNKTLKKGGFSFFGKKNSSNNGTSSDTSGDSNKGFSKTSDFTDYAKGTMKATRSSINMPVTLAAINYKLNALLVHFGVNYKYSNGYTAEDYSIDNLAGEADNEGRGELKSGAQRGKITGFQSGVYNKAIDPTVTTIKNKTQKNRTSSSLNPDPQNNIANNSLSSTNENDANIGKTDDTDDDVDNVDDIDQDENSNTTDDSLSKENSGI